jgi:cytochrome c oxidase subunit 2
MKKLPLLILLLVFTSVLVLGVVFYRHGNEGFAVHEADSLTTPGIALAAAKGCTACHSLDGTAGIGPSWKGTYGTLRSMADGSQRLADHAYLRESMLEPAADVVTGFENVMIAPELSEAEIAQLIQLIRQLGSKASG